MIETAPLAIALFDARSLRVLQLNQMAGTFFGRRSNACPGARPTSSAARQGGALADWLTRSSAEADAQHHEWRDEAESGADAARSGTCAS
jgi:hypothetical protein